MTDCGSIQGSIASSSSDVITTSFSWCSITPNSRIRVIRLTRPHSRRVLVSPDNNASYGFAVRGGREFGTGFFISKVERNSEADLKGLRVGDQIIRVNGYRVDDAVHKEFTQFIGSQDRLTIKVRGIGMFPIKENQNDSLTWHVLRYHPSAGGSECSYRSSAIDKNSHCHPKEVRIVLEVVPRTKLGLGICKGPEWKPGIFVQFTKEKSVARESGLRPGDQILSVNSIDFSDVLFSEAVAVMKSSSTLDMVIRTGSGLDLFPGESSGYNSSASSVTGDQSPCWADASAKRLTSVREEPAATAMTAASSKSCNERSSLDRRKNSQSSSSPSQQQSQQQLLIASNEMNRTIIKLSENGGASINNTIVSNERHQMSNVQSSNFSDQDRIQLSSVIVPSPPLPLLATTTITTTTTAPTMPKNNNLKINDRNNEIGGNSNSSSSNSSDSPPGKLADICFVSRQSETKTVIVEVHRGATDDCKNHKTLSVSSTTTPTSSTSLVRAAGCKFNDSLKKIRGDNIVNPPAAANNGIYSKSIAPGGGSLTNAITEELRKRKEKRQSNNAISMDSNSNNCVMKQQQQQQQQQQHDTKTYSPLNVKRSSTDGSALQSSTSSSSSSSSSSNATLRQQHKRNGGALSSSSSSAFVPTTTITDSIITDDQHNALMNEFKRAHQRMFKNGFLESDTQHQQQQQQQERKEALKNTTMMRDEVGHRSSDSSNSANGPNNDLDEKNQDHNNQAAPPPPPSELSNKNNHKISSKQWQPAAINHRKPPISPTPDYDTISLRNTIRNNGVVAKSSSNIIPKPPPPQSLHRSSPTTTQCSTRPGSISFGEYSKVQINHRKDPSKMIFLKTSNKINNNNTSQQQQQQQQAPDSLRTELQKTLSKANFKKQIEENDDEIFRRKSEMVAGGEKATTPSSSKIEKLTRMLQNHQNHHQQQKGAPIMFNGTSSTLNNRSHHCNKSKMELRKTESMPLAPQPPPPPPPSEYAAAHGILKSGNYARHHGTTEKSISFGN